MSEIVDLEVWAKGKKEPLLRAEEKFRKWLGDGYDQDLIHTVLATAAAERLTGDPLWMMIIGGPGSAKTETMNSLSMSGARVMGCITSPAAFLSGTLANEKEGDTPGTGGILNSMGSSGLLCFKDFTSVLSMHHTIRGAVLSALREIYDGHWVRDLGNRGGRTLEWRGRIGLIGGVTGVWDNHYEVIGQMGDRFALIRLDSTGSREEATERAMMNVGHEVRMREDLAFAVKAVLGLIPRGLQPEKADDDITPLIQAANLATMARSTVTRDKHGNLEDVHAPEMPTRFVKQLVMVLHGAKAIGLSGEAAMRLTMRIARDSISPPLRLRILQKLAEAPTAWNSGGIYSAKDMSDSIGRPMQSVRRELEALWMLGLAQRESEEPDGERGRPKLLYQASASWSEQVELLLRG